LEFCRFFVYGLLKNRQNFHNCLWGKGLYNRDVVSKKMKKIQLSWYVSTEVKSAFTEFCTENGLVIQDDCAGALTLWRHVPAEIRELAKLEAKGLREPAVAFWDEFARGLRRGIRDQLDAQQQKPGKRKKKS
jgi:hypothetical protein